MKTRTLEGGFSLIETLVAVSVLLVAVAGPLTIATKSYASALYARDQITAFYLAGEAVEYVRNKRDTNVLNGLPWLSGLSSCMDGRRCTIDAKNNIVAECGGACPPLRYDPDTAFYSYGSGGSDSPFTREVSLATVNEDEMTLTVAISWRTGALSHSFNIRENLLNWQ